MKCFEHRLSEVLETIRVAHLFCSKNDHFLCSTQALLNWAGLEYYLYGLKHLKTSKHILLTVWWSQRCKMRKYLHTSFVNELLVFRVSSNRSTLFESIHRGELDVQCCLPLYFSLRYTQCSPKRYKKRQKQRRVQTAANVLPKTSQIRYSQPLRVSLTNHLLAF